MPLLDHFHGPLSMERKWESFHAAWLGSLADDLNRRLPPRFFAETHTPLGGVEIDVATVEKLGPAEEGPGDSAPWPDVSPVATVPGVFTDDFEVRVFSTDSGPTLVAAVELVSPRNKDRSAARRAFAVKCASYLSQGIGLLVIDVVTERHANLHNEIVGLLESPGPARLRDEVALYAVAYRPVRRGEDETIELWPTPLAVGQALPTLPLALGDNRGLLVDLEAAYADARRRRRLA